MEPIDVTAQLAFGLRQRREFLPMYAQLFEGREKRLRHGVVVAVQDRAHRLPHALILKIEAALLCGVLGAVIRMADHRFAGFARGHVNADPAMKPTEIRTARSSSPLALATTTIAHDRISALSF